MTQHSLPGTASVPFVVRGHVTEGVSHTRYGAGRDRTALDLNALVWPGNTPVPLASVPVVEIIELLAEVGDWVVAIPTGCWRRLSRAWSRYRGPRVRSRNARTPSCGATSAGICRDSSSSRNSAARHVLDSWRPVTAPGAAKPSFVRRSRPGWCTFWPATRPAWRPSASSAAPWSRGRACSRWRRTTCSPRPRCCAGVSAVAPGHPLERVVRRRCTGAAATRRSRACCCARSSSTS